MLVLERTAYQGVSPFISFKSWDLSGLGSCSRKWYWYHYLLLVDRVWGGKKKSGHSFSWVKRRRAYSSDQESQCSKRRKYSGHEGLAAAANIASLLPGVEIPYWMLVCLLGSPDPGRPLHSRKGETEGQGSWDPQQVTTVEGSGP